MDGVQLILFTGWSAETCVNFFVLKHTLNPLSIVILCLDQSVVDCLDSLQKATAIKG